jgi:tetratricopeptide (TPR) repeat protein
MFACDSAHCGPAMNPRIEIARTIARALIATAAVVLILALSIPTPTFAGEATQQVCDVDADYYLGVEDYSQAIRRHADIVRAHPENALAHYHLGFALGMRGDRAAEVAQYLQAEALGLRNWDLFLNLGLVQFEQGDLDAAAASLQRAVFLGEDHPEAHFNLALVDEERGCLPEARRETLESLRLNPDQPAARNLLAVIYARNGETAEASSIWRDLVREAPAYAPAQRNLNRLGSSSVGAADGETAAATPRAAVVTAILEER